MVIKVRETRTLLTCGLVKNEWENSGQVLQTGNRWRSPRLGHGGRWVALTCAIHCEPLGRWPRSGVRARQGSPGQYWWWCRRKHLQDGRWGWKLHIIFKPFEVYVFGKEASWWGGEIHYLAWIGPVGGARNLWKRGLSFDQGKVERDEREMKMASYCLVQYPPLWFTQWDMTPISHVQFSPLLHFYFASSYHNSLRACLTDFASPPLHSDSETRLCWSC